MNRKWKQTAMIAGLVTMVSGLLLLPGALCWLSQVYTDFSYGSTEGREIGMLWLSMVTLCLGGGWILFYHGSRSLDGKPSKPLRLPPLWVMAWGLLLILLLGETLRRVQVGVLFFPPVFVLAGVMPPLAALTWAARQRPGGLTWRQFSLACLLGATVSVGLAIALEIIFSFVFLVLVEGLFDLVQEAWQTLVDGLAGGEVAQVLSSYSFVFAMIELALVAPLVEEFCKPLITLPMIRQARSPRRAFLIGAAAGAGFAALENLLYTGFGVSFWGGVLVLRWLGAAVHPLGSGLVALGWYSHFCSQPRLNVQTAQGPERPYNWIPLFGAAVGVHALWNGGSLLLVALVGANFFGVSPPEVDVLGVTLTGVILALLAVVGVGAWLGFRGVAGSLKGATRDGEDQPVPSPIPVLTDKAIAIWAVLCLIIALPMGLAALTLLGGGR